MKKRNSVLLFLLSAILSLFSLFALIGCHKTAAVSPISRTGLYFDTVISVTVYDSAHEYALEECFRLAQHYENLLSTTAEGSDLWNINHAGGSPVPVSEETFYLLQRALAYARLTDGRVDLTVAPLSALWNFSSDNSASHEVPSDAEIAQCISHINYNNLILSSEENTVTLTDSQAAIDLGFIAKGFIADKMKAYLVQEHIPSALINLGGNVLTVGSKPDGTSYTIAIQKPFADSGEAVTALSVSDRSIVTSGIYERYFEKDGTLYHHILDTKTGYPVENELYSVTILSSSSLEGDALSTACLLLGTEEGLKLIHSLPDTEALFIEKNGTLTYSEGFPK